MLIPVDLCMICELLALSQSHENPLYLKCAMIALPRPKPEITRRTVTVNFTFLEDIKNDHVEFTYMLNATAAAVSPGNRTKPSGLTEIFTTLRGRLAMHFVLEDAVGYFDDLPKTDFRLCEEAAMLQSQYKELYEYLC